MAGKWKVVVEPQGKNPGKIKQALGMQEDDSQNVGGMIVFVTNGSSKEEVSRVAFVRRNSKNPDVSFSKQFKDEIAKARTSIELLNEQLVGSGELV